MITKFEYTGKYPNLCSGDLTVEFDSGLTLSFGYAKNAYDRFWGSGGQCYFTNGYRDEHVEEGPWQFRDFSETDLPWYYKTEYQEICDRFQEEVPNGCCGGCL